MVHVVDMMHVIWEVYTLFFGCVFGVGSVNNVYCVFCVNCLICVMCALCVLRVACVADRLHAGCCI